MLELSIVIINYNTCKMTCECIDSVFKHVSGIDFEVILVDNASTDESKNVFSKDDRIKYIYSEKNLGFGRANNLGVDYSEGRNILFLNSDTLLMNNAAKILSEYLDSHPECGICGGNLFDVDGKPTYSFYRNYPSLFRDFYTPLSKKYGKLKYGINQFHNHTGKPMEVSQISGADLMINKRVINKYGCFNPVFFMYYEDAELCFRVAKQGYKIMSIPEACIKHLCGKSDKVGIANVWRVESRDNYFRLTGKSAIYRRLDAFYRKIVCRFLLFKYRKDKHISDIYKKCLDFYGHLEF